MNPSEYITLVQVVVGSIVGTASIVWVSAWWLSKKFSETKESIYKKIDILGDNIIRKLEYHEQHDDERFQEVRNNIWDIRVRNAARDGLIPLETKDK